MWKSSSPPRHRRSTNHPVARVFPDDEPTKADPFANESGRIGERSVQSGSHAIIYEGREENV